MVIIATVDHAPARAASVGQEKLFRYGTRENNCPAGLQPVTGDGTVSCGVPNQYRTYQRVMKHPAQRARSHQPRRYSARPD
ncbi:hypothetical protein DC366_02465 [Pelagivirga sediminicola]|uniref:Uncharacterized protein n=1 Tax=Pelagivirga sediminicola TaxID=2170575 RepID=A0A2T7GCE2_9RHOB|nr:hypothetical protein DC366_02465 [Pelagivirga sediminicola]